MAGPRLIDANPLLDEAGTNVRITFDTPMTDNADLSDPTNYVFTGGLTASLVTPEAVANPTYVDVTVNPMTNGNPYTVTVSDVVDQSAVVIDPDYDELDFTGYQDVVQPEVVEAVPQSNTVVRVEFSENMEENAALITPSNYTFSGGLQTLGVTVVDPTHVDIDTSPQIGGKQYTITVNTVLEDTLGNNLDSNADTATFAGLATPEDALVSDLVARTHPDGNRIDLEWTNPEGTTNTKILRKTRGFPFDDSDGVVVYDGVAIEEWEDDSELQDNQFYYYAVLASTDGNTYPIDQEASCIEGLSIKSYESWRWIWANCIPEWHKKKEAEIVDGTGLLEPVVRIMGAALDIIRGELDTFRKSANPDNVTERFLPAWNESFDVFAETSFDHAAMRRMPLHLLYIIKRKTTAPAIIKLVQVMCQWDCTLVEFGAGGGSLFKTWDGTSERVTGQGDDTEITVARGTISDPAQSFTTDQFAGGFVTDAMGNIVAVESNTATTLTLEDQTVPAATVDALSAAGGYTLFVDTTAGIQEDSHLLVEQNGTYENVYVRSVTAGVAIVTQEPLQNEYTSGALVYRGTDVIDAEITGTGAQVSLDGNDGLEDTNKLWIQNQWLGYYLLDEDNNKYEIVANTEQAVYVTGGTPVAGEYAIAYDFNVDVDFDSRKPIYYYQVYNGDHFFLFNSLWSLALIGTSEDPFDRLYGGITALGAGFTNDDCAVFVRPGVAAAVGTATAVSLNTLTNANANYTTNEFAGMYLNPNRKQKRMFQIVSNTATEIVVNQSIEGICQPDDFYFVLSERDTMKYQRVNDVLNKDGFIPKFTRCYVFFE